ESLPEPSGEIRAVLGCDVELERPRAGNEVEVGDEMPGAEAIHLQLAGAFRTRRLDARGREREPVPRRVERRDVELVDPGGARVDVGLDLHAGGARDRVQVGLPRLP